jgi:hypothetical protein
MLMALLTPESAHFRTLSETSDVAIEVGKHTGHDIVYEEWMAVGAGEQGVANLDAMSTTNRWSALLVLYSIST